MKIIKIAKHLNYISIKGGQFPIRQLSDALSFKVPGYQYSNAYLNKFWDGRYRFLKDGKFPLGLFPLFLKFCKENGIKVRIKEVYKFGFGGRWKQKLKNVGFDTLSLPLRPYQIEGAEVAFLKRRGIISIATGGGKTLIMIALINFIGKSTLVLTSKKESLIDFSNLLKKELLTESVGIVGGGVCNPSVFDVGSIQFLYRNRYKLKKYLNSKSVVMIDECHHASAKSCYTIINLCKFANWKIGFTATPSREPTGMLTEACIGPVIYTVSQKYLIKRKLLSPPEITMTKINKVEKTGKEKLSIRLDYQTAYFRGIETNEYRNNKIGKLCKKLMKTKEYPAVLMKTREHVRQVSRVLERKKIRYIALTGVSKIELRLKILEDMRNEKPRVVLFTTIFDEVLDVPALRALIIAGSGRSVRQTIQRIGRGMRIHKNKSKVRVFDFFDETHGYLRSHSRIRRRIYEEEGYKVTII